MQTNNKKQIIYEKNYFILYLFKLTKGSAKRLRQFYRYLKCVLYKVVIG